MSHQHSRRVSNRLAAGPSAIREMALGLRMWDKVERFYLKHTRYLNLKRNETIRWVEGGGVVTALKCSCQQEA